MHRKVIYSKRAGVDACLKKNYGADAMKIKKLIPAVFTAILLCAAVSEGAVREGSGAAAQGPERAAASLGAPEGAEVFLLVLTNGEEKNATGELSVYVKENGTFVEKLSGVPAKLGRGGVGKTKEGDQKTPLGTFFMDTPFGLKDAEAGFPAEYLKVDARYYWSGEKDATYNTLRNSTKDGKTYTGLSEHLSDYGGYYDYCINMGYNPSGTVGAGSALFLHCVVDGQNTGGCIAIPKEDMKTVLRLYKSGKTAITVRKKTL